MIPVFAALAVIGLIPVVAHLRRVAPRG
jgi:hypothetical protein